MNFKSMGRFIAQILLIEAGFMAPALILALVFREKTSVGAYSLTLAIILLCSLLLYLLTRGARQEFHEKEGLACVGLSWLVMSLLGCLPFYISGQIPSYIDALFETASGFTTTGASILRDVEALDRSLIYWRSFTHWLGGMGVLVFLLAVGPAGGKGSGFTMHLLRAESPGPSVGKLVPQIRKTARILYLIYIALTFLDFIFLLFGDISAFDAFCIAVGTAGTGGFAVNNTGLGGCSNYVQVVTTVFMLVFSINFSCYYLLISGKGKSILKDEEFRFFWVLYLLSVLGITLSVRPLYGSLGETLRHAFFQAATVASTTGFATTDFNLWPSIAKAFLLLLMLTGACAGSTCGGMKCSRIMLIFKNLRRNIRQMIQPNRILMVRNNSQIVDENVLSSTNTYLSAYVLLLFGSFFILSLDGFDLTTTFTAALTCFNNVGPGFGMVGPTGNFADFSVLSKLVLILDMIAGRLEIFPILALMSHSTWSHK